MDYSPKKKTNYGLLKYHSFDFFFPLTNGFREDIMVAYSSKI